MEFMDQSMSYQSKIDFTEEILKRLGSVFKDDVSFVKGFADDAAAALRTLANAINRQRAETISVLVQKGQLAEAQTQLVEQFESLKIGQVEEILKLSTAGGGEDNLRHAIDFIDHIEESFKPAALVAIYDELCYMKRLDGVEVLMLLGKLKNMNAQSEELVAVNYKIALDTEILTGKISSEIGMGKYDLGNLISKSCSPPICRTVINKAVENHLASTPGGSFSLLVRFSFNILCLEYRCFLLAAASKYFKQLKLLKTEQAMHLWAHSRQLCERIEKIPAVDSYYQQLASAHYKNLSQNEEFYFKLMKMRLESPHQDFYLYSKNVAMESVFGAFTSWYYKGNMEKARYLITATKRMNYLSGAGALLNTLFREMKQYNQMGTFEAFQLFHIAIAFSEAESYNPAAEFCEGLQHVIKNIPKSFSTLPWGEKVKFNIINKYFGDTLLPADGGEVVLHCKVPGRDLLWSFLVDWSTSLIQIKNGAMRLHFKNVNGTSVVCLEESKDVADFTWMVKTVDDEYFKIFNSNNEYLTAYPSLRGTENLRIVQMRGENTTDMQLWTIDTSKK